MIAYHPEENVAEPQMRRKNAQQAQLVKEPGFVIDAHSSF